MDNKKAHSIQYFNHKSQTNIRSNIGIYVILTPNAHL